MYDLSTFRLERILNNNTKSKTISLLGTFPSGEQRPEQQSHETIANDRAIVVLEKSAFTDDDVNTCHDDRSDDNVIDNGLQRRYFSVDTELKQEFINDIYGNFLCYPRPAINSNLSSFIFVLYFCCLFLFYKNLASFLFRSIVSLRWPVHKAHKL